MGWAELVRGMRPAIVLLGLICAASAAIADSRADDRQAEWNALNNQRLEASRRDEADAAISLAKQALTLARTAFGPKHPDTIQSMNNLAQ
jgi:hypothetical protein